MREYYDARAPEYDEWYLGEGRFKERERPGWDAELAALEHALAALSPAHTLDVACGTGFLTQHLRGEVVGLDQSARMIEMARKRLPETRFSSDDAFTLPFPDGTFERVFCAHFYGHLELTERQRFLTEARRVARELVICDAAVRPDREREEVQERILNDGSSWRVYKRFFSPHELVGELGDGEVIVASDWFVLVRSVTAPATSAL